MSAMNKLEISSIHNSSIVRFAVFQSPIVDFGLSFVDHDRAGCRFGVAHPLRRKDSGGSDGGSFEMLRVFV